MPTIFDNLSDENTLGLKLRQVLPSYGSMDVATGYLDLRGWATFSDLVSQLMPPTDGRPTVRILVGMVAPAESQQILNSLQREAQPGVGDDEDTVDREAARERKSRLVAHLRTQLMRGLATDSGRSALSALRRQLAAGQVEMRIFTARPLHGKTYIFNNPAAVTGRRWAYVGSSNLTAAGLYRNLELTVDVGDQDAAAKLADWFEDRWTDRFSLPITEDVIALIEESWAGEQPTPYEVYLKVCHAISGDAYEGMGYVLPASMRELLLDFQETAVRTLARRIVRRGGTMLGDVVGLGKTLSAIATAVMLQGAEDYTTLVLCPKNLVKMWEEHLEKYEVTGVVVSYSMADRVLPDLRRYHLVICDESHNLRNPATNVYRAIDDYIKRNSSKVLLLTATPYNIAFKDVAAQIGLYIGEDDDLGIQPQAAMAADPKLADKVDGKTNTLAAFALSEYASDWQRLMSEHLIRRTRTFVKRLAATGEDGRIYMNFANGEKFYFPERVPKPLRHSFAEDDPAALMESESTIATVAELLLPRYRLAEFDNPLAVHTAEDDRLLANIQSGRGNVSGFVRKGLFKRLSSSGYSFILSLKRQLARNELFIYAIDHGLALPVGSLNYDGVTDVDVEPDTPLGSMEHRYDAMRRNAPAGTGWINSTIFKPSLRADLEYDAEKIRQLLDSFGSWTAEKDSKINALVDLITTQHAGEKIVIFTEYKDTASYVADALSSAGVEHVGLATGETEDPTSVARRFSPDSNRLPGETLDASPTMLADPIDVLVATDVLSEGQNLQDSHVIVNYDLPWGLIRIVQRAGRVDRIGQTSDTVEIYTITHDRIEDQINLRERVRRRLGEAASAFGSDEQFFGTTEEVKLIEGIYSGQLPDDMEEGETEVDAVSEAWLVYTQALTKHPDTVRRALSLPDLVHSTRDQYTREPAGGVVSYVATASGVDAFALADSAGQRLLTPVEAMRYFFAEPSTPTAPEREDHFELERQLLHGPLASEAILAGNLKGIRKWVWHKLGADLFASSAAKEALDALYASPLTEHASNRFRSARSQRWSNEDLIVELNRLYAEDRLVLRASDTDTIRLVCSIGVRDR